MAKTRYINTCFRSDPYIESLDPSEKLLFLYFLSNEYTDLCGIYEVSIKRICFSVGFEKSMVEKIIERFSRDGKIYYIDWYIYVKNFQKHQNTNSPKIQQWIARSNDSIPSHIIEKIKGIDTLSIQYGKPIALNLTLPNLTKPNGDFPFESFWLSYKKKVWDKGRCSAARDKLSPDDHQNIMKIIPDYLKAYPDKKFRPYPLTFLNQRRWENDLTDLIGGVDYTDINNFHNWLSSGKRDEILQTLWVEKYREMRTYRKTTDLFLKQ